MKNVVRTQQKIRQYENRNKMLDRKLAIEKRKERNHRLCSRGGYLESLVHLEINALEDLKNFLTMYAPQMQGLRIHRFLGKMGDKLRHIRLDHSRQLAPLIGQEESGQPHHIVFMLFDVLPVDLLALLPSGCQIQPRFDLEGDQVER